MSIKPIVTQVSFCASKAVQRLDRLYFKDFNLFSASCTSSVAPQARRSARLQSDAPPLHTPDRLSCCHLSRAAASKRALPVSSSLPPLPRTHAALALRCRVQAEEEEEQSAPAIFHPKPVASSAWAAHGKSRQVHFLTAGGDTFKFPSGSRRSKRKDLNILICL